VRHCELVTLEILINVCCHFTFLGSVAGARRRLATAEALCRASCVKCVVCWEGFLDLIIKL